MPGISPEQLHDFFRPYRSKADHKTILDLYRSEDLEKVRPYRGLLGALGVPTTLLWGEKDSFVTVDWAYKRKEQEIPHAEVRIVEGAGHFIYVEAPEKVKVFVEEHLGQL